MIRPLIVLCCGVGLSVSALASPTSVQEFNEALGKTTNLEHGAEIFHTCASCHGAQGGGSENGDVPRIAGQHFAVIVRQLVNYRLAERWDIRMEHYAGSKLLGDSQSIADVAGYVSQLTGEETRNVGDGQLVAQGAATYAQRCARCHGPLGEGSAEDHVPRLAGQHYSYLLRQMHDVVDGRRPHFSPSHVRLLARLQRDDFVGIADFLARSQWSGPIAQVTQVR